MHKEHAPQVPPVTDMATMRTIHAVNMAQVRPTWVVVTRPESRIGGTSARLIDSRGAVTWGVQIANGDLQHVPVQWLSIRTR